MMNKLLLWMCRWCYKQLKNNNGRNEFGEIPTGIPSIRDPHAPCRLYSPRKRTFKDFSCGGDGHYLCSEDCAFYVKGFDQEEFNNQEEENS